MKKGKIPVLSCEGACIRGEIARLAANLVAKEKGFSRTCHGELFTASHSEIAKWTKSAQKVVVIDGCFMDCHGRILEHLIGPEALIRFDALSFYKKYTDRIDIDSVPEPERKETAHQVADAVLKQLGSQTEVKTGTSCGCKQVGTLDADNTVKACG
jgi:uncharacterized metal-binding protein